MSHRRFTWPSPGSLAVCLAGYAASAVLFTWPLVRHLSTRLTGFPSSDLGVYIWNLWVFRHELTAGRFPLFTSSIFSPDGPVNLSQHNYTVFSNILAVPLLPVFGVVASHNILMLVHMVAAATAMFLLAFHIVRRPVIAWLAGLLFGFSPMLVARSEIHSSLAAAAPLPLFVFILFRLDATRSLRWVAAAGATIAWAALTDPYYAVYCGLLAAWFLCTRAVEVTCTPWTWRASRPSLQVVDGAIAGMALVTLAVLATGGTQFTIGGIAVSLTTVYTPNLLLTLALLLRVVLTLRPRFSMRPGTGWAGLMRLMAFAASLSALLLSPVLFALAERWVDGGYVTHPILWRSSTPGADLMTFFLPNPNHVWLGAPWVDWLSGGPGGYAENVTSITVVAGLVILAAVGFARLRVPGFWLGLALLAGSLALGPFVRVAGIETHIPTLWAVLRYVPVIGVARAPARFSVLLILAVAVVFALALKALADRRPSIRRPLVAGIGLLLAFELCPAPRPLHDGTVPGVYAQIASDPRDVSVLNLPFGVRDGLSSFGDFSAASQFYQTFHGKRLIGGYLSRVSAGRVESVRRRPVLAVLAALSEGRAVSDAELEEAVSRGPGFVAAARLGYVVVNRSRASPELVEASIRILDLEKVGKSGLAELYRPHAPVSIEPLDQAASTAVVVPATNRSSGR